MYLSMKNNIFLVVSFFIATPLFVFAVSMYSLYHQFHALGGKVTYAYEVSKNTDFRALPSVSSSLDVLVPEVDVRVVALQAFLTRHKSPLADYSEKFVAVADVYGLDYRLLPSIAMQESNLCKKTLSSAPHNCWGFGIYGTKRTGFDSYDAAIEKVASTLSKKYIAIGLVTPKEIMTKYTPSSNGSWAEGVHFFMNQIDTYTN